MLEIITLKNRKNRNSLELDSHELYCLLYCTLLLNMAVKTCNKHKMLFTCMNTETTTSDITTATTSTYYPA